MGDFKSFKCAYKNMKVVGLYEDGLFPLEMIFNLKFGVKARKSGLLIEQSAFYEHLRKKIGLYAIEHELLQMELPMGWVFKSWNTRYTFEHSLQSIRQRSKPSYLGIDIAVTAPDSLMNNEPKLKENFLEISREISEMGCFKNTKYIKLVIIK